MLAELRPVLRPGGVLAAADGVENPARRELHIDDDYLPIDPAGIERAARRRRFTASWSRSKRTRFRFAATAHRAGPLATRAYLDPVLASGTLRSSPGSPDRWRPRRRRHERPRGSPNTGVRIPGAAGGTDRAATVYSSQPPMGGPRPPAQRGSSLGRGQRGRPARARDGPPTQPVLARRPSEIESPAGGAVAPATSSGRSGPGPRGGRGRRRRRRCSDKEEDRRRRRPAQAGSASSTGTHVIAAHTPQTTHHADRVHAGAGQPARPWVCASRAPC